MRLFLPLCLLLVSSAAIAAEEEWDRAPMAKYVAETIWQTTDDGSVLHLQSSWRCPAAFGDYHRSDYLAIDPFGLDVTCNYRSTDGDIISVSLTKSFGEEPDMGGAKKILTAHFSGSTELAAADQATFPSETDWQHDLYAVQDGAQRAGLWFAKFPGWNAQIRATFAPARQSAIFQALSQASAQLAHTAGAHLEACAKVPVERSGARIRDQLKLMGLTISATIVAFNPGKLPNGKEAVIPPAEWCAERPLQVGGKGFLQWHNIASALPDASGPFDRITPIDSTTWSISSIADRLAAQTTESDDPSAPKVAYHVIFENPDEIQVLGSYDGPPTLEELARFTGSGYRGINADIKKKTKAVTIYAPT